MRLKKFTPIIVFSLLASSLFLPNNAEAFQTDAQKEIISKGKALQSYVENFDLASYQANYPNRINVTIPTESQITLYNIDDYDGNIPKLGQFEAYANERFAESLAVYTKMYNNRKSELMNNYNQTKSQTNKEKAKAVSEYNTTKSSLVSNYEKDSQALLNSYKSSLNTLSNELSKKNKIENDEYEKFAKEISDLYTLLEEEGRSKIASHITEDMLLEGETKYEALQRQMYEDKLAIDKATSDFQKLYDNQNALLDSMEKEHNATYQNNLKEMERMKNINLEEYLNEVFPNIPTYKVPDSVASKFPEIINSDGTLKKTSNSGFNSQPVTSDIKKLSDSVFK